MKKAISVSHKGNFNNLKKFLKTPHKERISTILHYYGALGLNLLASATPEDSGRTSASWSYEVKVKNTTSTLTFKNSATADGLSVPIVILLHYGHATGTGGYVPGLDFIDPAIQPIFDTIAEDAWREVTQA